jgi:hypothetical protein
MAPPRHLRRRSERRHAANSAAVPPLFRKGAKLPELGAVMVAALERLRAKLEQQPWRRAANSRRRSERRRAAIRAAVPKGAALSESGAPGLAPGCI